MYAAAILAELCPTLIKIFDYFDNMVEKCMSRYWFNEPIRCFTTPAGNNFGIKGDRDGFSE